LEEREGVKKRVRKKWERERDREEGARHRIKKKKGEWKKDRE
jgi:hypothetical protein